ncbi:MAG TPA: UbiA family prenyltransferase, partial [Pseudomonadales bacterium]|nr:UbiA family prenyltransferase [Pseudomonadales bacterium]
SWTMAYDTLYAMVDRDDDLKVGIKSTAVLFAELDLFMVSMLYAITLGCLLLAFNQLGFGVMAYSGLILGALYLAWLVWSARDRSREACFKAFLQNYWFGLIVWAGLVGQYLF